MKPFISIIIPTYNHAPFLTKALRSVLDQEYRDFEVIVVDNHSSDNTDEVVLSFKDDRVSLLKIHNEGIIAASRNMGISYARGSWIAFLDSDDCWYKDRIQCVIKELYCNKFDVISTDEVVRNHCLDTVKTLRYGPYKKNYYRTMLLYGNRLSTSATIVKRSFLIENCILFNESKKYITVEDYDLWMQLAKCGAKFLFIRKLGGEYNIHGGNSSLKSALHNKNLRLLLADHIERLEVGSRERRLLYKRVDLYLLIRELRQSFFKNASFVYFLKIFSIVSSSPINSILIIYTNMMKKINIVISLIKSWHVFLR